MIRLTVPAEIQQLIDAGALFAVNNSGGKDSQAMLALLRQVVPARQLMVVHAHLAGEEWAGVEDHVREISAGLDVVIAEPVKTFVQMVEHRGMFPSPQQRQCTSDLKRGPIDREIRRYLAQHPEFGGLVVSCQGMRAQESTSRSKLEAFKPNKRNSVAGRAWFDWLPIHDLSAEDVFQVIAGAGQRPHWAYDAGMSRLSCMFCIMASREDLRTAARLNPEAYRERVLLERRVGHTMNMEGRGLEDVTGIRIDDQGEAELVIGADVAGDDQVEEIEAIVAIETDDQVEQLELAEAAIEADAGELAAVELVEDLAQDPAEALPIVYLVSCTKTKAAGANPARELYAASDWFAKARAYVEAQGAPWFILSAEHGLVEPGEILQPYETTLLRMRKPARRAWAELVIGQLAARRLLGRARFVLIAGETYREFLEPWLTGEGRWPELGQVPLRGLGLGEQKAWLARAAADPPERLAA